MWGVWGEHGCVQVWAGVGVPGCARGFVGVRAWVWEWAEGGLRGCAWVYVCVWDEFSEFLLENRVPTSSADFNTYPIRIFVLFNHTYSITS